MNPNTRIPLEDLTEGDCRKILDAYKEMGLHVLESAMNPAHLARDLREELKRGCDVEYRPDGSSQNKLDFGVAYASDGKPYVYAEARPLDEADCKTLREQFDKRIRELFLKPR